MLSHAAMLRGSSPHFGPAANIAGIGKVSIDVGVSHSAELIAATDAAVLRDELELSDARTQLVEAVGEAAAVKTFAVAGNFEMMNRLLDALGVGPMGPAVALAGELGVEIPNHFAN